MGAETSKKLQIAETRLATLQQQADLLERDQNHELELAKVKQGKLGRLFGSAENSPFYFAGIIAFVLTIALVVIFFTEGWGDKVKALSPILLALFGFMFGREVKG